jgi:hypothetical protein
MTTSRKIVAALVALAAAIAGVTIAVVPGDDGTPTITVTVDGLDAGRTPDRKITAPAAIVAKTAPVLEDQLRDEAPAAATPEQLRAARAAAAAIARTQKPLPTAGATAGFPGCRTSFVRNQSSRRGVRPQQMWNHYTVSPNVPGWADVNSVNALFDRASAQASSNFIIDSEGNCAYAVPIEAKSWTQAAANPFAISFEIIATGKERRYLQPPGLAKLANVQREVSRRTGIPMRRGRVRNCTPATTGIVQHKDGGTCSGGHVDIAPFDIGQVIRDTIAADTIVVAGRPITAANRVTCRKINAWRRAGRPRGGQWAPNSVTRVANLRKRGVRCTTRGPVRA